MTDPVLDAERAHLAASRAALQRMHDQASDWETATAGNFVSTQILRQQLYRRQLSLVDDPRLPLFFGRLDYATELGAEQDETCYIGRRYISATLGGDPMVIDWRAGMSLPFYRASPADPMGVRLRRRFGFSQGELTAFEDEDLAAGHVGASAILAGEIERPRSGSMRDIVATIQPDQDVLVRAPLGQSLCVQGAPGTGKTAVGLHRAAYLLYAYREELTRAGVLVVGPNDSFLRYIGDVLPALGEIGVVQHTVRSLLEDATGLTRRADDDVAADLIKGDLRMADVIDAAVWGSLRTPTAPLVVPVGHRTYRVPARVIAECVAGIRARRVRYEAGRQMLPQQLAHQVLLRMEADGVTTDDRTQAAVSRNKAVKALVADVWPVRTARDVVFRLLSDPDQLAAAADRILDADEQRAVLWRQPPRSAGSARWSDADLALLDAAADALQRTPSLGHVMLDEAQDLSPMQLRAVGRRASTGSVTLLGDLAQATTPWAVTRWSEALSAIGQADAEVHELVEGFRVPASVIRYASRLLPRIAPELAPPRSVRSAAGDLQIRPVKAVPAALVDAARRLLDREGTIGLIVPDAAAPRVAAALTGAGLAFSGIGTDTEDFDTRIDLVPARLAKGLEFDHVVVAEPAAIVAAEPDPSTGLRRLYVCLTRAVTSLLVLHRDPLPEPLTTPATAA